jgi:phosphopantetheinyl transferase
MLVAGERRAEHCGNAGSLSDCAPAVPCDWRYAALDELRLPTTLAWLTTAEHQACARFRDGGRQRVWLAGRLLAKRLIAARLNASGMRGLHSAAQIEIRSAGRRPVVLFEERRLRWSLSISHTDRSVLVGLSCIPGISIGVDLVAAEPCGRGFAETWFTPHERHALSDAAPHAAATLWGAKEAVYKAAGQNRPFDPRSIEVDLHEGLARLYDRRRARDCNLAVWRTPSQDIAIAAWHRSSLPATRDLLPSTPETLPSTPYSLP